MGAQINDACYEVAKLINKYNEDYKLYSVQLTNYNRFDSDYKDWQAKRGKYNKYSQNYWGQQDSFKSNERQATMCGWATDSWDKWDGHCKNMGSCYSVDKNASFDWCEGRKGIFKCVKSDSCVQSEINEYNSAKPKPTDYSVKPRNLKAQFFEDYNYQGTKQDFGPGIYSMVDVKNDVISSVKVPTGYKVILYIDNYQGGDKLTITKDTPDLRKVGTDAFPSIFGIVTRNIDNQTSSIQIIDETPEKITEFPFNYDTPPKPPVLPVINAVCCGITITDIDVKNGNVDINNVIQNCKLEVNNGTTAPPQTTTAPTSTPTSTPTATPTVTPTATPTEAPKKDTTTPEVLITTEEKTTIESIPWWVWLIVAVVVFFLISIILYIILSQSSQRSMYYGYY